ncbi:YwqG family protein [Bacillus pseudomycoides]|uniref:Cytoplasmic protein n=1 Tax=Bacillus pseudomycoides TaxID=64104 RepID=A0A2A8C723_9BACI|nr:YwqG family protein [Bacillus pseudomycoides]PDY46756.1 cytoplasmic protein [Bacillus pseudomycoides]PEA83141.1 cytoplasmic protein [Bacillus pseudomycoides]PEM70128.1 cytoplasmic protein [Bacillus pseudomycoides]PFZ06721.1 cytoplasmic protein [Bacillus pseudomycoides]PFZ12078.1 cytoplasmic protein [Bacillus pseudomycoides]
MTNTYHLQIPRQLEQYRGILEESAKPYIKITGELGETTLFESKFGGYPYVPIHHEHPKDSNGQPMMLFVQLNFREIPHVEFVPKKGLLQFFVSGDDDLVGADFDHPTKQKDFRIIYHAELTQDETQIVSDFSYLNAIDSENFIVPRAAKLRFEAGYQPVTLGDYRFEEFFRDAIHLEEIDDDSVEMELHRLYNKYFESQGHKIGGYPFFTQTDPREWEETYQEHNILLLQIDTDDSLGIMWEDFGIANFFIRKEDLLNLNFSNVLYNWDCC